MNTIQLHSINNTPVVESLLVAKGLGVQHKNLLETIAKYQPQIEASFGRVAFETRDVQVPIPNTSKMRTDFMRIAYLNEGQFMFIGSLSRNTPQVVEFKADLVQSFQKSKNLLTQLIAPQTDEEILAGAMVIANRIAAQAQARVFMLEAQTTEQEQVIKEQAPKVDFYNRVLNAEGLLSATNAASHFGLTANNFNRILKERKIQYKVSDVWTLYGKYKNKGYTEYKPFPYTGSDGKEKIKDRMLWTAKGLEFLYSVFTPQTSAA